MAYDVFISYSHVDKGFVTDFSGELDKIGVGYFLDEKELDWGSHINESIKSSLFESKCILVIISPASLKSEWVPFEIGYAIANGKKILPLLIHPSLDMPAYISSHKNLSSKDKALEFFSGIDWKRMSESIPSLDNHRGIPIHKSLRIAGLTDIENRQNDKNTLPPTKFYASANSEIAILALSAFRTFDLHLDILTQVLDRKVDVYFALLDPNSQIISQLSDLHGLNIRSQLEDVIDMIKRRSLNNNPFFHVGFYFTPPPFTGVMIDGEIIEKNGNKDDRNGHIRIQPSTKYQTQHKGLILQFKKTTPGAIFDLYANDMRNIWRNDVDEKNEYFI